MSSSKLLLSVTLHRGLINPHQGSSSILLFLLLQVLFGQTVGSVHWLSANEAPEINGMFVAMVKADSLWYSLSFRGTKTFICSSSRSYRGNSLSHLYSYICGLSYIIDGYSSQCLLGKSELFLHRESFYYIVPEVCSLSLYLVLLTLCKLLKGFISAVNIDFVTLN